MAAAASALPLDLNDGIRNGMVYLERQGLAWLRERKCASCHHGPMLVWVQREGLRKGVIVDETALTEATEFLLAADNRANILANPDVPLPNDDQTAKLGPLNALLAFREPSAATVPDSSETIPRWSAYLRSKQQTDGSWKPLRARPPVSLNDTELMTLTVLYGLSREGDTDVDT